MARKYYFLAIVALLLIPIATVVGMTLVIAINPEIAAGHANYALVFRLLNQLKELILIATGLVDCILWLLCCVFLLKAKARSYWWLPLGLFGPPGLAVLALLRGPSAGADDLYWRMVGRMRLPIRVVYEIGLFVGICTVAYQVMVLWRDFSIWGQSVVTGVSIDMIAQQQNASGGMYAFSEGLEVLFLVALSYLMLPICVGVAGRLGKVLLASRRE